MVYHCENDDCDQIISCDEWFDNSGLCDECFAEEIRQLEAELDDRT